VDTPAVVHLFTVDVDGLELGAFTECSGLSVNYALTQYKEGGENGYAHQLWGPVSYGNVTLGRPIDASTPVVAAWVSAFASDRAAGSHAPTGSIVALDPAREAIATWKLVGLVPVSWSGPSWSAGGNAVARETLVLAHSGFTVEGP
jgi:phage tail-like protein